jgi:hypothetical protein
MKKLLVAAILASISTEASAETYKYVCKGVVLPSGTLSDKIYPLQVNETKPYQGTLQWQGKTYKITKGDCAKYGWHAVGNGEAFEFCAATKGYAGITKEGEEEESIECWQTNR